MCRESGPQRLILRGVIGCLALSACFAHAQLPKAKTEPTDNASDAPLENFPEVMARMQAAKAGIQQQHIELLVERYDLGDHPAPGVTMARSKPVQGRARTRLSNGLTWDKLNAMSPTDIRDQGLFPAGFMPLPHPNHPEGGMLFPKFHIEEIKKQLEDQSQDPVMGAIAAGMPPGQPMMPGAPGGAPGMGAPPGAGPGPMEAGGQEGGENVPPTAMEQTDYSELKKLMLSEGLSEEAIKIVEEMSLESKLNKI